MRNQDVGVGKSLKHQTNVCTMPGLGLHHIYGIQQPFLRTFFVLFSICFNVDKGINVTQCLIG